MKASVKIPLFRRAIGALLFALSAEASADVRHITFENRTTQDADDLHLEFQFPVNINVPADITVPADARDGTQRFENQDVEMEGKEQHLWGGIVPGSGPNDQPGGKVRIRITSAGVTDIVITNWYWTKGGVEIPQAKLPHSVDDGRTQVLACLGGTATGSGRIQVAIGGQQWLFATTAGTSPGETLIQFTEFLAELTSDGTPLIYFAAQPSDSRLVFAGNMIGNPLEELYVEILARDGGQLLHVSEGLVFHPADVNQNFKIELEEVIDFVRRWLTGELIDYQRKVIDVMTEAGRLSRGSGYVFARDNQEGLQFMPEADLSANLTVTITNHGVQPAADLHVTFANSGGSVFVDPASVTTTEDCGTPNVPSNGTETNTAVIEWPSDCLMPGQSVTFTVQSDSPFRLEFAGGYWTGPPPGHQRLADIDRDRDVAEGP